MRNQSDDQDAFIEMPPQPLLIKQLLLTPARLNLDQEIVYRDQRRFTYRDLHERVRRLANALTSLGVERGTTVAVMEWDSHRYLECYFAAPMLGAVLQTVNIRLGTEQILYTLNDVRPGILILNADFIPVYAAIRDRLESIEKIILISDAEAVPAGSPSGAEEYEALLAKASSEFAFPEFSEETRATTFHTTGTTGLPKAVYFSHRQIVLQTLAIIATYATQPEKGRFDRSDVYMPITPLFHVHAWGMHTWRPRLALSRSIPAAMNLRFYSI